MFVKWRIKLYYYAKMSNTLRSYRDFPQPQSVERPQYVEVPRDEGYSYTRTHLATELDNFDLDWLLYTPDESIDDVAKIIVPGFAASRVVYERLAEELAKIGYTIGLYAPPREHNTRAAFSPSHLRDALRLQEQAVRAAMKAIHQFTDIEQFDLVGHSLGNRIALGATDETAAKHPIRSVSVRNILSDDGVGLDGEAKMRKVINRLPNIVKYEIIQGIPDMIEVSPTRLSNESLRHIASDLGRLAREGLQIMNDSDVRPIIERVRNRGVKYGALVYEKSQFFYPKEVIEHSEAYFDIPAIYVPNAYHVHPNTHPKEHAPYVALGLNKLAHRTPSREHDTK